MIVQSFIIDQTHEDQCLSEIDEYVGNWPADIVSNLAVETDVLQWDLITFINNGIENGG